MFTLLQLQQAAQHACGKTTFKTGNSTLIMVNQALNDLASGHPWIWRQKSSTLDLVINQSYIDLPADFEALRYLKGGANLRNVAVPTQLDRIFVMRQTPSVNANNLSIYYAINAQPQTGLTTTPLYRLELFPTPTVNQVGAFQILYLRDVPDLTNATDKPDIPDHLAGVLMMMVRGYAQLMENGNPNGDFALAQQMVQQAQLRDTMTQPNIGRLRGTVAEVASDFMESKWRFYTDVPVTV